MLAALCFTPVVSAMGQLSASFTEIRFQGQQDSAASLTAARIVVPSELPNSSFIGEADEVHIRTYNYTANSVAGAGLEPTYAGTSIDFTNARLTAGAASAADLFLSPIRPGSATIRWAAAEQLIKHNPAASVGEPVTVRSDRTLLTADVTNTLQSSTHASGSLRVSGSFTVSFWYWNFTVQDANKVIPLVTGAHRTDLAPSPLPAFGLAYTEFAQVAQVEIIDGWIELSNLYGAELASYSTLTQVNGTGTIEIANGAVTAIDESGLRLTDSTVVATGEFESRLAAEGGIPTLHLQKLVGSLQVDGKEIKIGKTGPIRTGTVLAESTGNARWAWPLSIFALVAVLLIVKGPAMTARFNRIQMRFDQHDYVGVLDRIESFTHRSKYARRASFLKAVSLLSLNEFKEASLYLQTLAPHEAPEPATKAFLQACAAAGLGQDSTAINHLSECLKDDPSYIEEAKTVPALVGYLPYFSNSPEEAAT